MRARFVLPLVVFAALAACGDSSSVTLVPPTTLIPTTTTAAPLPTTTAATTTQPATTSPPTTAAPTTTTTTQPATTITAGPAIVEIAVDVNEGRVVGEDRYAVRIGDEVRITVAADVSDEVHLHGYDITADVTATAPAVFEFPADIPGIFEVELENARLLLFELVVEP